MATKPIAGLLDRSIRDTADALALIDDTGWAAASRCAGWSVRQAGNHLVGGLTLLARILEDGPVDPAELDPQRQADIDHLGASPSRTLRRIGTKIVATVGSQDVLDRRFALPAPDITGHAIAHIALLESLVHGWDVATGAGVPFKPDAEVITAVRDFAIASVGDEQRAGGLFGPVVPTSPDADQFDAMLGFLGRSAS